MERRRKLVVVRAEVAELVDATVSKTVVLQGTCRFEPGLRHQARRQLGRQAARACLTLPSGVTVARGPLEPLV